jgi:WD40 repeat protein
MVEIFIPFREYPIWCLIVVLTNNCLETDILQFASFQGHKKWITGISWEPVHLNAPCRRFVSASKDGDARIWDISLRKSVICLSGHTLAITCVKWGGDGVIYTGYAGFSVYNYVKMFIRQPLLLF